MGDGDKNNFRRSFRHVCKNAKSSFRGGARGRGRRNWWIPFPGAWYCCPKLVVGAMLIAALLLCGVSIYGLAIIILLMFLFILL